MNTSMPLQWEVLYRSINDLQPLIGTEGVRDPEYPCEEFNTRGYDGFGKCRSDGHYLCVECSHLSPNSERFTQSRDGRRDRLRLYFIHQRKKTT